ncbi:RecB family exonuclease [Actinopolymorpha pittospori]|uniref:RecB family exonuclease n=1 Tax=Actinopolymorpha pittospori TaxID=648752 RepID=A0A927RD46_9ACTN|nr:PD-(D/E)XK nuclease family protein [Actinopolymorpha pittospori]MBE1610609.1 putative RecB family exonuclease [Actinopolymorpha pittospori]
MAAMRFDATTFESDSTTDGGRTADRGATEPDARSDAETDVRGAETDVRPGAETDRKTGPGRHHQRDASDTGGRPTIPLRVLSPSRASDFLTCPLRYRFRVIDRIPEQPSREAVRGTVVHAVLERLYDLPSDGRTIEQAVTLLEPRWQALVEAEPDLATLFGAEDGTFQPERLEEFLAGARLLLDRYFTLEDPTRLEPAEREMYVECELESGLRLRGYIDRLDVAPDGALRVVDYKTGRAPGAGYEQRAMFQMRFYALMLWRLRGVVPRLLQLVYLGSGDLLRYAPDEADLRATERKLQALWAAIERAYETGEWRASPGPLCDWCDHKVRCPAWGGTPPPLPTTTSDPDPSAAEAATSEAPSPHSSAIDL